MEASELKTQLKSILCKIPSSEDRSRVIDLLHEYYMNLDAAQRLDVVNRLIYFECSYYVFVYLRSHRQLMRNVGSFDKKLTDDFTELLEQLKNESY